MAMIDQKMVLEESLSLALASGASGYSDVLDVSGGLMKTGFGQSRENGIGEGGGIWFNSVLNTALTSSGTATVSIDTGDSLDGGNIESPATLMTFTVDKDSPEGVGVPAAPSRGPRRAVPASQGHGVRRSHRGRTARLLARIRHRDPCGPEVTP